MITPNEAELIALWRQAASAAARHEEDAKVSTRRSAAARDEAAMLLLQLKNYPPVKVGGPGSYEGRLQEIEAG